MKNEDLKKQILGGETPYRERLRLKKEIAMAQKRLTVIDQEATAELIRVGLRRLGKRGIVLDITQMNHICLSGNFRVRDWTAKDFDLDSHHGHLGADIEKGIHASVSLNDTHLSIQVSWKISDEVGALSKARSDVVRNFTRARQFFKRYGIKIDCGPAIQSMLNKMDDLVAAAALIHVFKGTGNTKRIVNLAKELKGGLSLAYQATYVKA